MELALNRNLEFVSEIHSVSVEHALGMLRRDLDKVCMETDAPGIRLKLEQTALKPECFSLRAEEEKRQLTLCAGSDLGFIYGICEISRTLLGVTDFWFWNDWQPKRKEAYPGLEASFDTHEEKFRELWEDGIRAQDDLNVIWNLGFRGQGDRPFWEDDPAYDTPKKRGELIGRLIAVQYGMVKERQPEAVCCTVR